jgi:hypothetical protein
VTEDREAERRRRKAMLAFAVVALVAALANAVLRGRDVYRAWREEHEDD